MLSPQTIQTLQEQIRRTARSLLQYIQESYPWTHTKRDHEIVKQLEQMQQAEQQSIAAMSRFLRRQRVSPPMPGPYSMHFTTMNFLALDRLLELLVEHQSQDVDNLEQALERVSDPDAHRLLQELLELKKTHFQTIQELNTREMAGSTVK